MNLKSPYRDAKEAKQKAGELWEQANREQMNRGDPKRIATLEKLARQHDMLAKQLRGEEERSKKE